MDYIQALLQVQAVLAAAFEEEQAALAWPQSHPLPRKKTRGPEQAPEEAADWAQLTVQGSAEWEGPGLGSGGQEEAPVKQLLGQLQSLAAANGRTVILGQSLSEQALSSLQKSQGAVVSDLRTSRFSGGLTGEVSQRLAASGIAGQQTHRSMYEISRYFERDARRYGG